MKLTKMDKILWNLAISKTIKEIKKWDGAFIDVDTMVYMTNNILKKMSYKLPIKN